MKTMKKSISILTLAAAILTFFVNRLEVHIDPRKRKGLPEGVKTGD